MSAEMKSERPEKFDHNYHNALKAISNLQTSAKVSTQTSSRTTPKTPTGRTKLENRRTIKSNPEKVLDLVRSDERGDVNCLVKYEGIGTPEWVSAREIRKSHPLLLIDYYETRIILRKHQCEMAFDCTTPSVRKLVVIASK